MYDAVDSAPEEQDFDRSCYGTRALPGAIDGYSGSLFEGVYDMYASDRA